MQARVQAWQRCRGRYVRHRRTAAGPRLRCLKSHGAALGEDIGEGNVGGGRVKLDALVAVIHFVGQLIGVSLRVGVGVIVMVVIRAEDSRAAPVAVLLLEIQLATSVRRRASAGASNQTIKRWTNVNQPTPVTLTAARVARVANAILFATSIRHPY